MGALSGTLTSLTQLHVPELEYLYEVSIGTPGRPMRQPQWPMPPTARPVRLVRRGWGGIDSRATLTVTRAIVLRSAIVVLAEMQCALAYL